jgi:hypothetical protein
VPVCTELVCLLSVQVYVAFWTCATYSLAGRPEHCDCTVLAWVSVRLIIRPWCSQLPYSDQYSTVCEVGVTGSGAHIFFMSTRNCDAVLIMWYRNVVWIQYMHVSVDCETQKACQYSEANVMHILYNLLRIKGHTCFEHYLLILRRHYTNGTWHIVYVLYQFVALDYVYAMVS